MTTFRCERFLVFAALLALLTACGQDRRQDSTSLPGILSDPSSKALSDRLGDWLEARGSAPRRIDSELVAEGFRRVGSERPCMAYEYRGKPETRWFQDSTLRIRIVRCGGRTGSLAVTRGKP